MTLLAARPPMGWNSWNSFATTITEAQALETARIMARELLPHGYDVFTIDIQWYEPEARSYEYNATPVPTMDEWGRVTPALNRFPSAADGKGFGPIAAEVHALGLKLGIHIMRGIPKLAVEKNLPVKGTTVGAADVADTSSTCSWNPDMYGVDMRKDGAQAYYDSIFALYAEWGVDFIKMDDMSRPYDAHAPEIEAVRRAIDKTGRPMVLSLSPGETPLVCGNHVREHAQMWRISDDFWDEWAMLEAQFVRLENWNPYRRPGAWPDADMLPLGRLALGARDTRFTPDEQKTLMSLWAMARSPLIMGGDLRHLDDETLALLTNQNVLRINQRSTDNRPHFLADGARFWTARDEETGDWFVALFNLRETKKVIDFPLERIGVSGGTTTEVWTQDQTHVADGKIRADVPAHGVALFRLSP